MRGVPQGRVVQIDPMKLTLKAPGSPGSKHLKPQFDQLLSNFGFNFNLRRYTKGDWIYALAEDGNIYCFSTITGQGLTLVHFSAEHKHVLWDTFGA